MYTRVCSLRSGSSGNAVFIESGRTGVLVDVGVSGVTVERALAALDFDPSKLSAMLVTHEHKDHIAGVGVLARRYNLPIYVNRKTYEAMSQQIGPVDPELINLIEPRAEYVLGDLAFSSFELSHDAADPVGYKIKTTKGEICICTDTGQVSTSLLEAMRGCRLVFLEANYDDDMLAAGFYPEFLKRRISSKYGHLSNLDSAGVIAELIESGTESFILSHLSKDNNIPELALVTIQRYLENIDTRLWQAAQLSVAARYDVGKPVLLE